MNATPTSAAHQDWLHQKQVNGEKNSAIDSIMELTGLEDVKAQVLRIKAHIDLMKRQGVPLNKERLNLVLLGNPGTGKYWSRFVVNEPLIFLQEKPQLQDCMHNS